MVGKMRMVGNSLNIQQTVKFIGYWIFIEYSMNSKVHWILNIDQVGGGQGRRVSLWGDRFHQALLPHPLRKKFLFPSKFQILNKFQLCPKFIRGGAGRRVPLWEDSVHQTPLPHPFEDKKILIRLGPPNILGPRFETGIVFQQYYFKLLAYRSGPITLFSCGLGDVGNHRTISG